MTQDELWKKIRSSIAALNYEYYRLAGFDIRGVLTMSRFAKDSYVENPYITNSFKRKQLPAQESYYHQPRKQPKIKETAGYDIGTLRYSYSSILEQGWWIQSVGREAHQYLGIYAGVHKLLEPYFEAPPVPNWTQCQSRCYLGSSRL
jgi:hypothetical protein